MLNLRRRSLESTVQTSDRSLSSGAALVLRVVWVTVDREVWLNARHVMTSGTGTKRWHHGSDEEALKTSLIQHYQLNEPKNRSNSEHNQ